MTVITPIIAVFTNLLGRRYSHTAFHDLLCLSTCFLRAKGKDFLKNHDINVHWSCENVRMVVLLWWACLHPHGILASLQWVLDRTHAAERLGVRGILVADQWVLVLSDGIECKRSPWNFQHKMGGLEPGINPSFHQRDGKRDSNWVKQDNT